MKLFATLRNYKIEYLPRDIFSGGDYRGSIHSHCHGLCADRRTACGVWTVWLGISDPFVCIV